MSDPAVPQFYSFLVVRSRAFLVRTRLLFIAGALLWLTGVVLGAMGHDTTTMWHFAIVLMSFFAGLELVYDLVTAIIAYFLMMNYGLRVEEHALFNAGLDARITALKGVSTPEDFGSGKPN